MKTVKLSSGEEKGVRLTLGAVLFSAGLFVGVTAAHYTSAGILVVPGFALFLLSSLVLAYDAYKVGRKKKMLD